MDRIGAQFAKLLTAAVKEIKRREGKQVGIIQDELGYALGKSGGYMIEHWRKGNLPAKLADFEKLAELLVVRLDYDAMWLDEMMAAVDYPAPERLRSHLFPEESDGSGNGVMYTPPPTIRGSLAASEAFSLPTTSAVRVSPLPAGSHMPLRANPFFVGRERDILALVDALNRSQVTAIGQVQIAAATGLGGIGKTQLACEFAHRYGQFFPGGVYWFNFEDAGAIAEKIAESGGPGRLDLSPSYHELPLQDQLRLVQDAWNRPIPRLLIFDNCEDESILEKWLPISGGCRVLVTSRRGAWDAIFNVETIALDVLYAQDSIILLRELSGVKDDFILGQIAVELGHLPLALHLAGKYLKRYQGAVTPEQYLEELKSTKPLQHASLQDIGASPTLHIQHIARTFALSYNRLDLQSKEDLVAHTLLTHAAHFVPGEPIWFDILSRSLDGKEGLPSIQLAARDGFARLIELGLVESDGQETLKMHRLVAAFVRETVPDEIEASRELIEDIVFAEAIRTNESGQSMPLLAWSIHLRSVAERIQLRRDRRAAELSLVLGEHWVQRGEMVEARQLFEEALNIAKLQAETEDWFLADCHHQAGRIKRELDDDIAALPHLETALQLRLNTFGENHYKVAESHNELGRWYYKQGETDTAISYFQSATRISTETVGLDHRATADYLNNLGMAFCAKKDYEEALSHIRLAWKIRERVWGEVHPRTALSLNNMGFVHHESGRFQQAHEYYERALRMREKVCGETHPDTAQSWSNLGYFFMDTGRLQEARMAQQRAIQIRERVFGQEHLSVSYPLSNLGQVLDMMGRKKEATPHFNRALNIRRKVLGNDHQLTAKLAAYLRTR